MFVFLLEFISVEEKQSYILVVTEKGYGKCVPIDAFRTQRRGGKGSTVMKFKPLKGSTLASPSPSQSSQSSPELPHSPHQKSTVSTDAVSNVRVCHAEDEVVISTSKGTVTRQRVDAISVQSRHATGVLLQSIDGEGERILSVGVESPVQPASARTTLVSVNTADFTDSAATTTVDGRRRGVSSKK